MATKKTGTKKTGKESAPEPARWDSRRNLYVRGDRPVGFLRRSMTTRLAVMERTADGGEMDSGIRIDEDFLDSHMVAHNHNVAVALATEISGLEVGAAASLPLWLRIEDGGWRIFSPGVDNIASMIRAWHPIRTVAVQVRMIKITAYNGRVFRVAYSGPEVALGYHSAIVSRIR